MEAVQALCRIPYRACRFCLGSHTGRVGSVQDPIQGVWALCRIPDMACRLCIGSQTGRVCSV
eukprot:8434341-Pyramimonas_sp.AAC.1